MNMLDCLVLPEYKGRCLVLWQFAMLCFADAHRRPAPSERIWRKSGSGVEGGGGVEGEEGGEAVLGTLNK